MQTTLTLCHFSQVFLLSFFISITVHAKPIEKTAHFKENLTQEVIYQPKEVFKIKYNPVIEKRVKEILNTMIQLKKQGIIDKSYLPSVVFQKDNFNVDITPPLKNILEENQKFLASIDQKLKKKLKKEHYTIFKQLGLPSLFLIQQLKKSETQLFNNLGIKKSHLPYFLDSEQQQLLLEQTQLPSKADYNLNQLLMHQPSPSTQKTSERMIEYITKYYPKVFVLKDLKESPDLYKQLRAKVEKIQDDLKYNSDEDEYLTSCTALLRMLLFSHYLGADYSDWVAIYNKKQKTKHKNIWSLLNIPLNASFKANAEPFLKAKAFIKTYNTLNQIIKKHFYKTTKPPYSLQNIFLLKIINQLFLHLDLYLIYNANLKHYSLFDEDRKQTVLPKEEAQVIQKFNHLNKAFKKSLYSLQNNKLLLSDFLQEFKTKPEGKQSFIRFFIDNSVYPVEASPSYNYHTDTSLTNILEVLQLKLNLKDISNY